MTAHIAWSFTIFPREIYAQKRKEKPCRASGAPAQVRQRVLIQHSKALGLAASNSKTAYTVKTNADTIIMSRIPYAVAQNTSCLILVFGFDRRSLSRHQELIDVDLLKKAYMAKTHPVLGQPLLRYQEQLRPDVLVCSQGQISTQP